MNPTIVAAIVGFAGVLLGLVARDIVMPRFLSRRKREEDLADRSQAHAKYRLGDVRSYADPLYEATKSLGYRLDEIIEVRNMGYLLASAPETLFVEYKRLSTTYRLAALLGWIRAFRRERSYLDPEAFAEGEQTQAAIWKIEEALADGRGVEGHRLDELLRLWKVPGDAADADRKRAVATEIEGQRHRVLTSKKIARHVDALSPPERFALVEACAELIREGMRADLPAALVEASADEAILYLQIREAYIYRDWQAAIGDFMIIELSEGPRRFAVRGFGEFEDAFLAAKAGETPHGRWFDRLDALFHDLDMSKQGFFDARREQMRKLRAGLTELETVLRAKVDELTVR